MADDGGIFGEFYVFGGKMVKELLRKRSFFAFQQSSETRKGRGFTNFAFRKICGMQTGDITRFVPIFSLIRQKYYDFEKVKFGQKQEWVDSN